MAEPGEAKRPSPQGGSIWTISRWWWEPDVTPTPDLLEALHVAAENFARYLRARAVRAEAGVPPEVRQALTIE